MFVPAAWLFQGSELECRDAKQMVQQSRLTMWSNQGSGEANDQEILWHWKRWDFVIIRITADTVWSAEVRHWP